MVGERRYTHSNKKLPLTTTPTKSQLNIELFARSRAQGSLLCSLLCLLGRHQVLNGGYGHGAIVQEVQSAQQDAFLNIHNWDKLSADLVIVHFSGSHAIMRPAALLSVNKQKQDPPRIN